MAMARPIIATGVCDLPDIVQGCGWIVDSERPDQLVAAIQHVFDNPDEAAEMSWKARKKCVQEYSWNAMENVLLGIFREYE